MNILSAGMIEGFTDHFLLAEYEEAKPVADCHRAWWDLVCRPDRLVAFAAPRGHAKSTSINHAYGLAAALFKCHPFQLKVSKTYALACEKVEQAKKELLTNEKIRAIFRLKTILRDRENDFIAEMADGYQFRMYALGMGQATRGLTWGTMRPSLVHGDDIEDDEEVLNPDRRDKGMRWILNTLLPMGGDYTLFRIYGTILHNDSALARLCSMPSWTSRIWEACDDQVSEESILWPQKFPRERLIQIKQTYIDAGNLAGFNMEYRNIAIDLSSGFFRPEDFPPIPENADRDNWEFYVGVDFAISTKARRDYTVLVVGGMDPGGFLNICDVRRGRWDGKQIIDEMLSVEETYHPAEWFIEAGQIEKALRPAMELRMREANDGQGLYMNLTPLTSTADKSTRARSFQARTRAKAVRYDRDASWFPDYEVEMLQFPLGKHDDQVDGSSELGRGLARMATPLSAEEEEEIEDERQRQEHLSFGRSAVTGY